ncbi:MAG: 6-phospho-alpha-glucosidase [Anaerorhabdus sp.]|uniref:family 4 glycosyl hydrolase n=1 Tax=Anaerorhabdus sp. TaxID=1872524 RepID=UPI002FCC6C39
MKKYSVTICGGGSTYTPDMLELLCVAQKKFPIRKVVLFDIDYQRQKTVNDYAEILFNEYCEGVEFFSTLDPKEAFEDMDFAFVQIRAGGMDLRNSDEKIPYTYDCIGQETCGPGGLSYGVRSVIEMKNLINSIRTYSPNSWIINYSNPAAIVAEMTKRVFPNDKRIINICDMPTQVLDTYLPLVNKKRSEIEPRYFGLNHYGWFTKIIDKKTGEDLLPEILKICVTEKERVHKLIDNMYDVTTHWGKTFEDHLDMIQDYPYSLPNTYNLYYLYPDRRYSHYDIKTTRYDEIIEGREKNVIMYCNAIKALGKMKGTQYDITDKVNAGLLEETGCSSTIAYNDVHATYLIELVISIIENGNDICLLMIQNNGIIPNLSSEMMLEVPCRVGSQFIEPLHIGPVSTFEKGLLENQFASESLLVDAVLENDKQKMLQAFTINRLVNDTERAKKIIAEFEKANGKFWPKLKG